MSTKGIRQHLPVADTLPDLSDLSSRFVWARRNVVRASQNWVATEASHLAGSTISQQYVASIESGSSRHPKHLDILAIVLGVPLEWLYEGRGSDGPQPIKVGIHKVLDGDLVLLKDTVIDKKIWSHEGKDINPWILVVSDPLAQQKLHIGDLLVVQRSRDPKPGEYAVLRSQDLGYFVRMTSLQTLNGKTVIEYVDDFGVQSPLPVASVDTLGTVIGIQRGMIFPCV